MSVIERILGTEAFGETCTYGPPAVIQAPALIDSPLSLVTSCPVIDDERLVYGNNQPDGSIGLAGPDTGGESTASGWGRWVNGFEFLPEIVGGAEGSDAYGNVVYADGLNCPARGVSSAFLVIERDQRSTAGFKGSDAQDRILRALPVHEPWRVENQFWTGSLDPNMPHLTAPGCYVPVGGAITAPRALGYLEEMIAETDAGQGVIHCTVEVMTAWSQVYSFRYDGATPANSRHIWTPNGNLVVPGYGYDGSAPVDFGSPGSNRYKAEQWAFATDMQHLIRGQIDVVPDRDDFAGQGPQVDIQNMLTWRAIRPWGIYSNGALRGGVLVSL